MTHRTLELTEFHLRDTARGTTSPISETDPLEPSPDSGWLRAIVPGGVRESLIAAGLIENPYYGDNERKAAWVDERYWWYITTFAAPETDETERVRIVFDGLDTVADIWLNGALLGHHENQFRPAEFDITARLQPRNHVLVRFSPPLDGREIPGQVQDEIGRLASAFGGEEGFADEPAETESGMLASLPRATTLRKAAFSWGWDFGPNVPSLGIWRSVRLEIDSRAVITGHHIALTSLAADHMTAEALVAIEADLFDTDQARASVRLRSPGGATLDVDVELRDGRGETTVTIPRPELWWTHDLGDQPLYDVDIELLVQGEIVDSRTDRIGLRLIELDRGDHGNRRFQFRLNHVPTFQRGAAWLPPSTLVGSVSATTYRNLVLRARDGNLTMLRVWGGGIYENESFYAACDELGVLIWQDFMFACIDYPDELPELRKEVALEAEYQVRRLRNRACLALWAGNNEVHVLHLAAYQNVDPGHWGWHFFHQTLPHAVNTHDLHAPYWPGSPYGEDNGILSINGTDDGDRHTWEVWHGMVIPGMTIGPNEYPTIGDARHYRRYAYDTARFVSEFGIHASPELATLRRWIPDSELSVHSYQFDLHNKDTPKNKGDELLAVTTGLPTSLNEYVAFTQAVQAEGMAFGIEHYRRRQPETAGALMWQFNDVWPGFSWSVVDVDGVPKAAYYAARRASAPLAVSFRDTEDGDLELWLVNNRREPVTTTIDVEVGTFDGSQRSTRRVAATAEPGQSVIALRLPAGEIPRDTHHYVWASSPANEFPPTRKHFDEIGKLTFGPNALQVHAARTSIHIQSIGYSYQVRISQPLPGIQLSDNCFDLRDGDEVTIAVEGIDARKLSVTSYPTSHQAADGHNA